MTHSDLTVTDAYRLIDALRDYADTLDAIGSSLAERYRADAETLERSAFPGNRTIDNKVRTFDFVRDAAHTATVALMLDARESASEALLSAEAYTDQANRLESLVARITA